ncbi:MAG: aldehyde ferredoxin oxidoreductase family protein [Dehalococcoidales bacterium]|nr:aldehyde ferredoxin oxidoreductase family protein [Dehalococcoidales bacterium]
MATRGGYWGKVLFVDLTTGSIKEESLPEKMYRDFIGGQGLGARILFEHMKPKADPLGPDNMLGFLVGPMQGTGVHGARFQVVGKSPITGGWGDSNSGGSLAADLKATGYDGIFFSGISPKPVYLFLNDGKAELKDATSLWGKDTVETADAIVDELGDKKVKVTCIGPSGEAKSLMAAMMHEGCAAGRSGLGAVMGSKRLKALAVRGTNKVPIVDPERMAALRKDYLKSVKETQHPWAQAFKGWGTPCFMGPTLTAGSVGIKNWTLFGEENFPGYVKLHADAVTQHQPKKHACLGCPLGCKGSFKIETKAYGLIEGTKPEYETLALLGPNCLIDDLEAITKANELCNQYGMDTVGVGSTIAFAMECYDRGVITKRDTDGIELTWGNADAMVKMVEKMCQREGFGAVLADGSKIAAERIGKGSEQWAMHVGGQDIPAHDARVESGYGWGYFCDPTPARHTASQSAQSVNAGVPFPESDEVHLPGLDPLDVETSAPVYATCSDIDRLWTSMGFCIFGMAPETMPLIEMVSAVTGWDFTLSEGLKTGRRIQALRQAFNIREGVDTTKWCLPERLAVAMPNGPMKGRKLDFKAMKEKGYQALGWDPKTGKPLPSTLEELGLKELVGTL